MSRRNLELFRQGLAAWNDGDYEAIVEMCHPDVEWTFSDRLPDATGEIRGKASVRAVFETFTGDWSEISIRPGRIAAPGSHVVANVEFLARGRDGIEVSMPSSTSEPSGRARSSAFAGSERSTKPSKP
jgi:ketosteroid isomerase-like protein